MKNLNPIYPYICVITSVVGKNQIFFVIVFIAARFIYIYTRQLLKTALNIKIQYEKNLQSVAY